MPTKGNAPGNWQPPAHTSGAGVTLTGVVVRLRHDKGFGFIRPDNGENDHFFHYEAVVPIATIVHVGDVVRFVSKRGEKGLRAVDVTVTGADRTADAHEED